MNVVDHLHKKKCSVSDSHQFLKDQMMREKSCDRKPKDLNMKKATQGAQNWIPAQEKPFCVKIKVNIMPRDHETVSFVSSEMSLLNK